MSNNTPALVAALRGLLDMIAERSTVDYLDPRLYAARAAYAATEAAAQAPEAQPVAPANEWEGAEEWMPLAWQLCADECGEEACNELVWEGGPNPGPWGDRWLKYEDEAKRLIALVRKHVPAVAAQAAPGVPAPVAWLTGLLDSVMSFRHTPDGMVRGGAYVTAQSLLDAAAAAPQPPAAQAQPADDEAVREKARAEDPGGEDLCKWSFGRGWRAAEDAHGIGIPAAPAAPEGGGNG